MNEAWDCIVIGAGPAGLSAALNLCRRGKRALVLSGGEPLLCKAEQVDNYLGLPQISGRALMERFAAHAREAGAVLRTARAGSVLPFDGHFLVGADNEILQAGTVILACGVSQGKPVPGESRLLGRGVSYCATCDGMLYRGRSVAVWGLCEDAPREAMFLHGIGCTVTYIAARRPEALGPDVAFLAGRVEAVLGTDAVEAVQVGGAALPVQGVFILRQAAPADALAPGLAVRDGYVQTDAQMRTNLPGLFAAGDVTGTPLQVANAVGDGLVAALSAVAYLDQLS